jgi:N-acetylneuraminic acid mutarotase
MSESRKASTTVSLIVVMCLLLTAAQSAAAESSGTWGTTRSYPVGVADASCVMATSFIYCVGGFVGDTYTANGTQSTDAAYYAETSPSGGIAVWTNTTSYPVMVNTESCAASDRYIYCVGGYSSAITGAVYYAALTSSGISQWNETTSYPTGVFGQSCLVSGGYIYCVGGYDSAGFPTDKVYYAKVSESGVGTWVETTSYPINVTSESCIPSGGEMYCVGGIDDARPPITDAVYYGNLSSTGISSWTQTTSYPTSVDIQSCVTSARQIYCIGGAPDFAATDAVYRSSVLPSGGVGPWARLADYPNVVGEESCVVVEGFIYCAGGAPSAAEELDGVYYASASSLDLTASPPSSAPSVTTSSGVLPTNTTTGYDSATTSTTTSGSMSAVSPSIAFLLVINAVSSVLLWLRWRGQARQPL